MFGNKRTRKIEVVDKKKKSKTNGEKKGNKVASTTTSKDSAQAVVTPIGMGMTQEIKNGTSVRIDNLTFTKYEEGCLVLGYVLHVHEDSVVVSLPGGLTGTVEAAEVSDYFHHLVKENANKKSKSFKLPSLETYIESSQPIRCAVLEVSESGEKDSKKRFIRLSMRASLINRNLALRHLNVDFPISGAVVSVEDHG